MVLKKHYLRGLLFVTIACCCMACASDEEDNGEGDNGDGDGKTVEGDITIPLLLPTTGGLGAQGQVWEYGILLAQKEINDAGGVLGRELVLDIRDSQTDNDEGVRLAESFLEEYDTRFLIHCDGSGSAMAVAGQVTLPNDVLIIATVAGTTGFTTIEEDTDLCFRSVTGSDLNANANAALALADGFENIAMYYEEHPYTQSLAASFSTYVTENGGAIAADVTLPSPPPADHDFAADWATLESSDADAIYVATYPEGGMNFLEAWGAESNFNGGFYLDGIFRTTDLFTTLVGTDLEGMRGVTAMGNPDALEDLQAAMEEEFGQGADLTISRLAENYDAVYMMALAIEQAGSTKTLEVRDALREIANPPGTVVGPGEFEKAIELIADGEDINYEGAGGDVDLDEYGNVSSVFENWEIQGEEFVSIGTWTP